MKRVLKYLLSILSAMVIITACNDESSEINIGEMKVYRISCDPQGLDSIYSNPRDNTYIPIEISYKGRAVEARMRIRGDTSRDDPKKSLKIRLDTALTDVPEVLNLNAEYADPTYVRQFISAEMMRRSGQLCYEVEHIQLYINDEFAGIYLQVENMDDDFLKRNALPVENNLYKATKDGACLSLYDDVSNDWEKKTNRKGDRNDLLQLIEEVNAAPDADFKSFLEDKFHYGELINLMALNMMLSNASTYYHNYYLYHDLYVDGKWRMLPWDMDKTLSYYDWMPYTYHRTSSEWESDNALIERALMNDLVFEDISERVTELHGSHLNDAYVARIIDSLEMVLVEAIPKDTSDKVGSLEDWRSSLKKEKGYFDRQFELLESQFKELPRGFKVYADNRTQTVPIRFCWGRSTHPQGRSITYRLTYGTDHLLKDSITTVHIEGLTDTTFTLEAPLEEGMYYWKVTATDGTNEVDGFNTKNILRVKNGTRLPAKIEKDTRLTIERSPYIAALSTEIITEAHLMIDPGVEIHFPQDAMIDCAGKFSALGTFEEPIIFRPMSNATSWKEIFFHTSVEKGIFKKVRFEEGVLSSKAKVLEIDSCVFYVNEKDVGQISGERKDLIYADNGIISIRNSSFFGNGSGEGMVLFDSEVTTENCNFHDVPDAIEYIGCEKGAIISNYVENSPDDAIDLNNCNNILIEGNMLFNNKDKAVSIGTEQYGPCREGIVVKGNLMVGNNFGIAIKDSSRAYLSNNAIVGNTYGINAYRKREDYGKGGFAQITNTIFHDNKSTNAYADEFSEVEISNSLLNSKLLPGDENIQAEADFINAPLGIYHLMESSSAIGAGVNGEDLGAFQKEEMLLSFVEVHVRSSEERPCGDYIAVKLNYNIPIDLSLFSISIQQNMEQREFIFPIGTRVSNSGIIYVCRSYPKFKTCFQGVRVIGGLPALKPGKAVIRLLDPSGYELDVFSYDATLISSSPISYKSNGDRNRDKRTWMMIPE